MRSISLPDGVPATSVAWEPLSTNGLLLVVGRGGALALYDSGTGVEREGARERERKRGRKREKRKRKRIERACGRAALSGHARGRHCHTTDGTGHVDSAPCQHIFQFPPRPSPTPGTGETVLQYAKQPATAFRCAQFVASQPGNFLLSSSRSGALQLWNVSQPQPLRLLKPAGGLVQGFALLPAPSAGASGARAGAGAGGAGKRTAVLVSFADGGVCVYDLASQTTLWRQEGGHTGASAGRAPRAQELYLNVCLREHKGGTHCVIAMHLRWVVRQCV